MQSKSKKLQVSTLLSLLCWLVYASSYTGKVNYTANLNQIMSFYNVNHSSAGLVSTFFFFAYGVGQVVNGILSKKYNIKWMIFSSLLVSGIINLIVAITNNFNLIKVLWLLNGISMSVLWPSLVRLLAENLNRSEMPKASVIMGTSIPTGTLVVYFLSAVFVKINFKLSFYLPAVIFIVVALIWLFSYNGLVSGAKENLIEEDVVESSTKTSNKQVEYNKNLIMMSVCALAFYGVATNLIKDGLITWVPSILKEQYHLDNSLSIILTLALPFVAIFANAFAVKTHTKISDFVLQCALMFLISGCIIAGVIAGISFNQFILTLVGFTIVCFLITSCNSVITGIFPLFMKGKVNSGLIAGVLNGFCYLGSTISSYGLGIIADNFGWVSVFGVLFGVCCSVVVVAVIYSLFKRKTSK